MVLAFDEELEMNVYEEEIEVCEFPQCMEYVQVYRIFCDVFDLGEKREKFQILKEGIVIEIRNKEDGHNVPHIHAHYQGENISISLIDGEHGLIKFPDMIIKIQSDWKDGKNP